VSLERSEGKWLRAGTEVDYSTVDAFLRAVTGATGAPVGTSAAEVGQAPADDLEIVLAATAGDETLRLIGSGVGRLAARSGRDVLLRIVDDSVEDILGKLEELRAVPASAAATG